MKSTEIRAAVVSEILGHISGLIEKRAEASPSARVAASGILILELCSRQDTDHTKILTHIILLAKKFPVHELDDHSDIANILVTSFSMYWDVVKHNHPRPQGRIHQIAALFTFDLMAWYLKGDHHAANHKLDVLLNQITGR